MRKVPRNSRTSPHAKKLACESLELRLYMAGDAALLPSPALLPSTNAAPPPTTLFEAGLSDAGLSSALPIAFNIGWFDYNADGFDDLWLGPHGPDSPGHAPNDRPAPQLYRNNGNGTFTNVFAQLFPDVVPGDLHGSLWADLDNDGDLDFIQSSGGDRGLTREVVNHAHRVYLQHNGSFTLATAQTGLLEPLARGREIEMLDVNRDGLLDLFFSNSLRADGASPSELFLRSPKGYRPLATQPTFDFTDDDLILSQYNDVTGDGKPDLISLDSSAQLQIHEFTTTTAPFGIVQRNALIPTNNVAAGIRDFTIGDFNRDGFNDILVIRRDVGIGKTELLQFNPATSTFVDRTTAAGLASTTNGGAVTAGDFDNDADLDFYLSTEAGAVDAIDYIFLNAGNGTFVREAVDSSTGEVIIDHGLGRRVASSDFNNDGFLDVFLSGTATATSQPNLHRNTGNGNRWISLNLEGILSTRDAVGAKVTVTAGGITQTQYQTSGKHHFAQNSTRLHFGLGTANTISQIQVTWPSGRITTVNNIASNQQLVLKESKNNVRWNARNIPVGWNAGTYNISLNANLTQQYFKVVVDRTGQLQLPVVPVGMVIKLETNTGTVLAQATAGNSLTRTLTPNTYFIHAVLTAGTSNAFYKMRPFWTLPSDKQGPSVDEIMLDHTRSATEVAVKAVISDAILGGSNIINAKFWIDTMGLPDMTGTKLKPYEINSEPCTCSTCMNFGQAPPATETLGSYDHVVEYVSAFIPQATYNALSNGPHTLFVRGRDASGRWGPAKALAFNKFSSSPAVFNNMPAMVTDSSPARLFLAPNGTITDPDTTNFNGAELTVRLNNARPGDRLDVFFEGLLTKTNMVYSENRIRYNGVEIGRYFGGWKEDLNPPIYYLQPLQIRFNAQATAEMINLVLQRIQFWNDGTSTSPLLDRTVEYFFHDAQGGRSTFQQVLRHPEFENFPRLTLTGNAAYSTSAATPVAIAATALVQDANNANFNGGSLTVNLASNAQANDRLTIRHVGNNVNEIGVVGNEVFYSGVLLGTFSGGSPALPLVINFSSTADATSVAALLLHIQFSIAGASLSSNSRSIHFRLNDGDGLTGNLAILNVTLVA